MTSVQHLLIVSHVPHYRHEGKLFAYGPYVREIDIWADLFGKVIIAAPLRHEKPSGDSIAFTRSNISICPQLETGGNSLFSKAVQLLTLPIHICRLVRAMRRADMIHVRCPGNLGLLGCLLAPCFRKPRVAKYAGQWNDYKGEPRTWQWQKALLRSRWWRAPVLVYGEWPNQPPHIIPFFTSIIDEAQMARAHVMAPRDWSKRPLETLFVGRLSEAKNADIILRALAKMDADSKDFTLRVIGDGPMRSALEALALSLGLADRVTFEGAVSQSRVLDFYERAHILVLASQTEGWPKVIAEAMAFGLVCIGSNRGLVPQMLDAGKGFIVEPRDIDGLAAALTRIVCHSEEAVRISERASTWAQQFTLEGFRNALRGELESRWGISMVGQGAALQMIPPTACAPSTLLAQPTSCRLQTENPKPQIA